jgi:hypothetical protein
MFLSASVLVGLVLPALAQLSTLTTPFLNLTALTAAHGESVFECWQLSSPFKQTTESGISGALQLFLGDMSNASYSVIPPRFDGGFHHAPAFQYVVHACANLLPHPAHQNYRFVLFTSGLAHISLYKGDEEVWIQGGKYGLLIAADTADRTAHGHLTRYPSAADTVALTVPIKDREGFKYKVLHPGPCREDDMIGI